MKYILNKNTLEKLFYIIITIFFFSTSINLTMISEVDSLSKLLKISRYLCYVALAFIIVCNIIGDNVNNIKKIINKVIEYIKNHILLVLVLFLTSVPIFVTGNKIPLILTIVIWASSFYETEKILKVFLYLNFFIFLIAYFCSMSNVIPEITVPRETSIRYSLGYIYPLELTTHFLFLIMTYVYLKGSEYDCRDCIFINIINLLLFKITDARSSFILILMFSFVSYLVAQNKINIGKIKPIYFYVFLLICCITPIVCSIMYDNNNLIMEKLNQLLSKRLYLSKNAFNSHGFPLFGKMIEWVGYGRSFDTSTLRDTYNYVDCAYAKILLDQGIVILTLVIAGYGNMIHNAFKRQDNMLKVIICVILVISVLEPRLFNIEINPFLIMMGYGLVLRNEEIKKFLKIKGEQCNEV